MRLILSSFVAAVLLMIALGASQDSQEPLAMSNLLSPAIASMSFDDFEAQLNERAEAHKRMGQDIVRVLASKTADDRLRLASMYLAGVYRVAEASPELARQITFQAPLEPMSHLSPWKDRPAMQALVRIGLPALKPLLSNIASSDDAQVSALSRETLVNIVGTDIAKAVIQEALHDRVWQDNAEAVRRFRVALGLLTSGQ